MHRGCVIIPFCGICSGERHPFQQYPEAVSLVAEVVSLPSCFGHGLGGHVHHSQSSLIFCRCPGIRRSMLFKVKEDMELQWGVQEMVDKGGGKGCTFKKEEMGVLVQQLLQMQMEEGMVAQQCPSDSHRGSQLSMTGWHRSPDPLLLVESSPFVDFCWLLMPLGNMFNVFQPFKTRFLRKLSMLVPFSRYYKPPIWSSMPNEASGRVSTWVIKCPH